jgi:hypothetical protein
MFGTYEKKCFQVGDVISLGHFSMQLTLAKANMNREAC